MKTLLLSMLLMTGFSLGSTTTFLVVKMPVCLVDEGDSNPPILILDVPILRSHGAPESEFGFICTEYKPHSAAKWVEPYNVNVAAMYGIRIDGTLSPKNDLLTITIDASKAKKPEDMRHSVDEVVDAVEKCVRLMESAVLPIHKKVIVRKAKASD
jgi:hypothetical protein